MTTPLTLLGLLSLCAEFAAGLAELYESALPGERRLAKARLWAAWRTLEGSELWGEDA